MNDWTRACLMTGGLFVGMLISLEAGIRLRHARMALEAAAGKKTSGFGAVEGAMFALLGLLVAFTFSGAANRFDGRRQLIVQEANDIGTAYLRLQLLPPEPRAELQQLFREYFDARLVLYTSTRRLSAEVGDLQRSQKLQERIWARAVDEAGRVSGTQASMPPLTLNTRLKP